MSYPVWPAGLPHQSAAADWQVQPFRAPLQTEMEAGNVRARRRPGDGVATMRWSRYFKDAEMASFETFVVTTYNLTQRWVMPVSVNGRTYENRVVQMVDGPPTYASAAPGIIRVSMTLLVYPADMTPA